jgi:putative ABC transport system permease protein
MGIRLALGASPRQLLAGVVGRGALLAVSGVALGLVGAIFTGRAIESFLFGVPGADPRTLAAVSVVLLLVSIAASYGPARRALKVDPTSALRSD